MRVKLTNMLSIFADSLGQQASRFEPDVGHGCSPKANLIFPACLGKCLVTKPDKPELDGLRREGATPTQTVGAYLNL